MSTIRKIGSRFGFRLMRYVIFFVIAFFSLFPLHSANAKVSNLLSVCTYNIRQSGSGRETPNAWTNRCDDLANLILEMDSDLLALQEVTPIQLNFLKKKLRDYAVISEFRNADRKSGEASPVFYRRARFELLDSGTFWLSETPEVSGSRSWNSACPRVCTYLILVDKVTGKRMAFFNTHADHASAAARINGTLLILERMKKLSEGMPVVYVGDHNCGEDSPPSIEVSKVLQNAMLISETPPKGPWRTYNGHKWRDAEVSTQEALKLPVNVRSSWKISPKENFFKRADGEMVSYAKHIGGRRLDYIYVSSAIRVLSYATRDDSRPSLKLYPSDHFPVMAEIILP